MNLNDYLTRIKSDATAALALGDPPPPPPTDTGVTVKAGGNLQAALDAGGDVHLENGAIFEGAFVLKRTGTRLLGPSASIVGPSFAPALFIPPGTKDVQASLLAATTSHDQAVIQVGINDETQTTRDAVPTAIVLTIQVPRHRGKRAFAINGGVTLLNCGCRDVWDPAGRDSQGIGILNTHLGGAVKGGTFEAGSETILLGGDKTAIPDAVPTGWTFEDVTLIRPLEWKIDAINRKVKNLFEVKSGIGVTLRRAVLSGCWVQGQTGWAIMLTPRDGKTVSDVLLEDVTVSEVGGVANLLGYDDEAWSPQMARVTFRRVKAFAIHKGDGWGEGRGWQWQGSPAAVTIEACTFDGDGTAIYVNPGDVWASPTSKRTSNVTQGVVITGNRMTLRPYGIMLNGFTGARNWRTAFPDGFISANAFTAAGDDAAVYRTNLPPSNTVSA